jgi:hypothetical protein
MPKHCLISVSAFSLYLRGTYFEFCFVTAQASIAERPLMAVLTLNKWLPLSILLDTRST